MNWLWPNIFIFTCVCASVIENCDSTWPPDRVPALQDDSGKQGEANGVHFQPLVLVLERGAPGSVVLISVFDPRLQQKKKKGRRKRKKIMSLSSLFSFCQLQKPIGGKHCMGVSRCCISWPAYSLTAFRWRAEECAVNVSAVLNLISRRPPAQTNCLKAENLLWKQKFPAVQKHSDSFRCLEESETKWAWRELTKGFQHWFWFKFWKVRHAFGRPLTSRTRREAVQGDSGGDCVLQRSMAVAALCCGDMRTGL